MKNKMKIRKRILPFLLLLGVLFIFRYADQSEAAETRWVQKSGKYYLKSKSGKILKGWQEVNGKWYYLNPKTGVMKTGWLEKKGKWYYLSPASGAMLKGWVQVGSKWYYMNPSTGAMKKGWLQVRGKWYFLNTKSGAMQTGWVKHKGKDYYMKDTGVMAVAEVILIKGNYQCFSGNGDWLGNKSNAFASAYQKALDYLEKNTSYYMTKAEKLRTVFDLYRRFTEKNPWIPHYRGEDWVEKYANDCFDNRSSNCIGYGATFALMARALGYDNVYACNSLGHGWCEIDGMVYDPEWTLHRPGNFFGRPLRGGESQNYLGAISRTSGSLGWVKI